ncbi:MAG: acetyltransferase [Cyclobacteriaceae bacterium]|nr:acetyltransferase [Cyclobacteriaceae bacterium]
MVLLYGAGGHAKVVLDALNEKGIQVRGFVDDTLKENQFLGVPVLGAYDPLANQQDKFIITIGDNSIRKALANKVTHSFDSIVSSSAVVSPLAKIGDGAMVLQGVIVQSETVISHHVILNTGCRVDHDCVVGAFSHIAPGAILCGRVSVGEGTLVGAGSVVIPGIRIGNWCTIGAGSVIVRDIPDGAVVAGNPSRQLNK